VAIRPTPGRSLVTRRAVADIVRTATLGSYGVTGFAGGPIARLVGTLGIRQSGIVVRLGRRGDRKGLHIELDLTVALGVPVAEVARQVDSAVRYAIRQALGQEVARLVIHIDGLRLQPGTVPEAHASTQHGEPTVVRSRDLADSGTDVA
jgi:uncharacterized alkaline shock family protein YloU